ncbi:MAG: recombinase family protein [Oscillospiraceae bacterium]|nr:recombinase family protein [Oscillospiraceae bacterium]
MSNGFGKGLGIIPNKKCITLYSVMPCLRTNYFFVNSYTRHLCGHKCLAGASFVDYNAFAERKGLTVIQAYTDRVKSGKNDNRPDFQRMIADCKKGLFDVIVVWKIDRFSRDKYDSAHCKFILKQNNVKLISATEPIDDSPEGQLMESIFEGIGYKVNEQQHFQVDTILAPVVREVYVDYVNGSSIKAIVDDLNNKGIRTAKGGKITINTVTHLLKNRRYLGEDRFKDVVMENAFEPIVSPELFDSVQTKMEKNKKAPARKKDENESFILITKLFCGKCGAFMAGESGTGKLGKKHCYVNAIQQGILNDFTKARLDELQERKEQLEVAILKEKIKNYVNARLGRFIAIRFLYFNNFIIAKNAPITNARTVNAINNLPSAKGGAVVVAAAEYIGFNSLIACCNRK